jgi:CDP-glucose 4,6-dehydratase
MPVQFNNIYKGKKVLVTGHTGFKGSWMTLWLTKMGAKVVGYSLDIPTKPSHYVLLDLDVVSVKGDILDKKKIEATIKKYKPDIVFHLAAQALVRPSYEEPQKTIETNVMGTVNVLEACRKNGIKAIVNVTSDKCYQNLEQDKGYKETDPMGGNDPYSASKGAVEIVSQSYRTSFGMNIANVRAGNVIGGGDWAKHRLIPDIMRATSNGKMVPIRNPIATRPWQHVLEPISGYLLVGAGLLEGKKEIADNWNFGPSDTANLTVQEVTKHTKKHWDIIMYEIDKGSHPHEAKLLRLDSSKANSLLKWKSVWDNNKTFEKTVNWYKNFYTSKKVITEEDLESYISDALKAGLIWVKK